MTKICVHMNYPAINYNKYHTTSFYITAVSILGLLSIFSQKEGGSGLWPEHNGSVDKQAE